MDALNLKLSGSISQLTEFARASKIISINIALLAEQIPADGLGSMAAIKVVALEIQRLSDESHTGLAKLHVILDELRLLIQTINLAGRQRMLSQKIMKLHLISKLRAQTSPAAEYTESIREFSRALEALDGCRLNTPAIFDLLRAVTGTWQAFLTALQRDDLDTIIQLNEQLLQEVHRAVLAYEELSGLKGPASTSPAWLRPHGTTVDSSRMTASNSISNNKSSRQTTLCVSTTGIASRS